MYINHLKITFVNFIFSRYASDFRSRFDIDKSDLIFLCSPLSFDPSIVDIFLALHSGATLLITSDRVKSDPNLCFDLMFERHHVTFLQVGSLCLNKF